jgi:hypothetical protein
MTPDEDRRAAEATGLLPTRVDAYGQVRPHTDAEIEDAIEQLAEIEMAEAMLERLPDQAMVIGTIWQRYPVEVRQAIAALCWMSYAWGWLHHREGRSLA